VVDQVHGAVYRDVVHRIALVRRLRDLRLGFKIGDGYEASNRDHEK
jgi:hypothetical protein